MESMVDIDVETVEKIDESTVPKGIQGPEYVLYGGKGGVGKTTMAAATALASARDGTATLVISTDPAHSLSDTLEADISAEPTRISDDIPLFGAEIDPEAEVEKGAINMGPEMDGFEDMIDDEVTDPFTNAMPGTDEAAAIRILIEYIDDDRFDRIVIDTAPTGHTLRLLELPDIMDSRISKILEFRDRIGGMVDSFKNVMGGGPNQQGVEEGIADLRELRTRIERLRDILEDPTKTDFRVVMVPEELSVKETRRLLDRLDTFSIPVQTVVVNRVMEELTEVTETEAEWYVSPNTDTCDFCQRRWNVQQKALQRSQELFRDHDIRRVPLFAEEVQGEQLLRIVAACLER